MKTFFRSLYINKTFFVVVFSITALFIVSYFFENLFGIAKLLLSIAIITLLFDILLLYRNKKGIVAERILPEKLSNGDQNSIEIRILNTYRFGTKVRIIDEIPVQFQKRDFEIQSTILSAQEKNFTYTLRPTERGEYYFGNLLVFTRTYIGFVERKQEFSKKASLPTYPSFLQLRKYDFLAFTNKLKIFGLKKIRRIGHTLEFEQIKEYVTGDDIRNINWKATAKKNQLMVNQYQDEKSQPIYSVIDTGRVMKMPFDGLSLLDYAINATLVISNIAIKKQDKAGMFTFSRSLNNMIVAQRRKSQMNLILETLYNIKTDFVESDFSRLYIDIKRNITQRSLLLLYTNFETLDGLHRQLPFLQSLSKKHLLVVIFFENTELKNILNQKAETTKQIFEKTIAEKFVYEKKMIVNELRKHGIQSILTSPEDLTINTINKYLEIKSRGLI